MSGVESASAPVVPVRIAIVGCGIIGVNHARAIARTAGFEIAAVVDPVEGATTALADLVEQELGAARPAAFAGIDALPDDIDAVAICTPSGTHVELAEQALARDLHVVLEKPLDVSLERGRRLAALAEAAAGRGVLVSVISQHRFDPASVVVAEAAHSGRFGRITSAVASVPWWRSQEYYDSGAWRGTWELDGGGAVMNQGVHTVDLLLWFLSEPVEVFAQTALLAHERVVIEDVAVATVRFASGALAVFHATTAANPGLAVRVQVHGSAGSGIVEDDRLAWYSADGDPENRAAQVVAAEDLLGAVEEEGAFAVGHARQYADVVDALREGRAPAIGVPEALRALAVVRAFYVSATRGEPVRIADLLSGAIGDEDVRTGGAV